MLRLLLLRHAKAERSRPGERDHDRPLAERGRGDAPKIGRYMALHSFQPDLAVVSTAQRARETWNLAASAFERPPSATYEERIYEAAPQAILNVVKETGSNVGTLLVVGHNPGLQELATLLVASGDVEARQRLKEGFPTGALAVIGFALDDWGRLHAQAGRLEHLITPRWLAAATE